jgi:hypothetical protein
VVIEVGGSEKLVCEGETIIVNLHGALISTVVPLNIGMSISVNVYLTANVPQLGSYMSILSTRFAAESNWINLGIFGECLYRLTTG